MEKLLIQALLKTPFVTGGGYMTFDALLASILFDELQDVEKAHESIPIKKTSGLFHASAAIYEPIDRSRVAFVANLRADHSLSADLFPRKADGSSYRKIGRLRRRDFGAVMNSYDSINCASIEWFVEGDGEKIQQLVEGVSFIGKRRANGFGEVSQWVIEQGDLDGLTGIENEPLRPIPLDLFQGDPSSLKVDAAWKPAYWDPANRAVCYAPEAIA